jgi:hypothetical protein
MEMFKLVMVHPTILLSMKMSQFICVIVKKDLHDHVWTKLFLKELFEGLSIMVAIYTITKSPSWNFYDITLLSKKSFDEFGLVR